jgi:hypothetical protein
MQASARLIASLLLGTSVAAGAQPGGAAAQPGGQVVADVIACKSVTDLQARFACYEETVTRLRAASERREIVVVDREEVRRTRRSLFGFALPRLRLFGSGGENVDDAEPVTEITTSIAQVRPHGHQLWSMTLADGSVWQTTEPSRLTEPRSGHSIRITAGAFGGYLANIDGARAVRVTRTR